MATDWGSKESWTPHSGEAEWGAKLCSQSASFQASQQGYEGVFCPARKDKTLGRGKGGLAILSRLGTPMLRAIEGPQAELGRWMHALIQ
eukprot:6486597-Amphidinium_carterae.1